MTQPAAPAPKYSPLARAGIAIAVIIGLIVLFNAVTGAIKKSSLASGASTGSSQEASDDREPVTFSGEGQTDTTKQPMSGDYSVSWQTLGDCYYGADLEDGGHDILSAEGVGSGTTNVYGLEPSEYYLQMITGPVPSCGWTITFTPA